MKTVSKLSIAVLMIFIFSGTLFAGQAQQGTRSDSSQNPAGQPGAMQSEGRTMTSPSATETGAMQRHSQAMTTPRASEIIGLDVKSQDNQKLGEVNDLIIGDDGRIDYLVISEGGVLGVGDKLKAVPWNAADVSFYENSIRVGLSKDKFDSAPTFADWNEFQKDHYSQQVRSYYGEQSRGKGTHPAEMKSNGQSGTFDSTPGTSNETENNSGGKKY